MIAEACVMCYNSATQGFAAMKTINLRDANQQFSKLVRQVEETGETIIVLRNGKPAIRLAPADDAPAKLSPAQLQAKARLMDPAARFSTGGWAFDRDAIYDDRRAKTR